MSSDRDVSRLSACKRHSNELFIDKRKRLRRELTDICIRASRQLFRIVTIRNRRLRQENCLILEYSL